MSVKRGYFQLATRDDGLYLTVYQAEGVGSPADFSDFTFYLDQKNLYEFVDVTAARKAFDKSDAPVTVKISEEKPIPTNEFAVYNISSDFMQAKAVFYPPFEGAQQLVKDEIIRDLQARGVKNGIDEAAIDAFLNAREYGREYVVAQGTPAREGQDGRIEYKFNVDLKAAPKLNEDGTVDFHSLDNVNHIKKGDVLAELIPEDKGDPGMDLMGRPIMPHKVKHVVFRFGRNMSISEDGRKLISNVSGHVTLEDEKIFVSDVMELTDVDASTGNIDYNGNVDIKGNVLSGFTVKASGNISVSGIVEGASLIAGGDITMVRGVQGSNRAVIKADGNIITKFIESAETVVAGGSIETDCILHSKVIAQGAIVVKGKKGLIVGGDVKSTILIEAKNIGNDMGTSTSIGVGVDATLKKRIDTLKKELETVGNNKLQLNMLVTALRKKKEATGELPPDKIELQQKTMRQMIMIEQQINQDKKELEELRQLINEDENARIKIHGMACAGTKVTFGEQYIMLKERYDHCQFCKQKGDIKCITL